MGRVKGNQQRMVIPGGLGAVTSSGPNLLGRKQSWHLEKAGIAGLGGDTDQQGGSQGIYT